MITLTSQPYTHFALSSLLTGNKELLELKNSVITIRRYVYDSEYLIDSPKVYFKLKKEINSLDYILEEGHPNVFSIKRSTTYGRRIMLLKGLRTKEDILNMLKDILKALEFSSEDKKAINKMDYFVTRYWAILNNTLYMEIQKKEFVSYKNPVIQFLKYSHCHLNWKSNVRKYGCLRICNLYFHCQKLLGPLDDGYGWIRRGIERISIKKEEVAPFLKGVRRFTGSAYKINKYYVPGFYVNRRNGLFLEPT